ncbi:hypothetical protein E2542_SST00943 [Spatholobus suberectus]|nr:hypothetical protein E2542_SST00943 [Spatholobus suberectus]
MGAVVVVVVAWGGGNNGGRGDGGGNALILFMASNNNTPSDPMISSGQSLIPPIRRHRKLRNPGIAVAFRPRGHTRSSQQKNEVSVRKLAAGLWQWQFMEVSRNGGDVFRYAPPFPSSKYQLANGNVKITFPRHNKSGEKLEEIKDQQRKPITILRSRNGLRREV